ncbi:MAG: S9 family peptidase, partial [Comamonadaceae bacterium]
MKPQALIASLVLMSSIASAQTPPTPPDVAKKPHVVKAPFGAERQDEYYWLRDDKREDRAMLGYLDAENAYADALLAPLKPVQDKLYDEIVARIKQDDASVPARDRGYWYYSRFETGKDYPVHARRKDAAGLDALSIQKANAAGDFAGEEILLDVNTLAADKKYYAVGDYEVSPDNRQLAYADDTNGRRQYTIRFKDLATGTLYPESISGVSANLVWADDNKTLFYVENDPETLLTTKVKKHVLGTDPKNDPVVYEEKDDSFYMGIDRTRDDKYLLIVVDSTVSNEVRYAPAADPAAFVVLAPRARDVEYGADHFDGRWVIRTNDGKATNFKIVTAADGATARKDWKDWIAHRSDVLV